MYKAIFIDLDDTVFSFAACSRTALGSAFEKNGLFFDEDMFKTYRSVSLPLWEQQKSGLLSVRQVFALRFVRLREITGLEFDPDVLEHDYNVFLAAAHETEPFARDALHYISDKYSLYAASNGIFAMQENRLELAHLLPFFDDIFVSDVIGYDKPDKRFF